jgi:hypothetical protein
MKDHFRPGREARPPTPAQARGLHLAHDPVAALGDEIGGAVPWPRALRALQRAVLHPVEVGEDAVLVLQHVLSSVVPTFPPETEGYNQRPGKGRERQEVDQKGEPGLPAVEGTSVPSIRLHRVAMSSKLHRWHCASRVAAVFLQGWSGPPWVRTRSARSAAPGGHLARGQFVQDFSKISRRSGPRSNPCRSAPSAHSRRRPGIPPLPS